MIQPTTENKYRFNMQVSARAIGCRNHSLPQPDDQPGTIDFRDIRPMIPVGGRQSPTEVAGCAKW
jgi:hypothetical protein